MTGTNLQQAQGISTRLKEARTARGLSQAELGKLAGFNRAVVQNVEHGMLWHPSVISGLAVALDVTSAWVEWGESSEDERVEKSPHAKQA